MTLEILLKLKGESGFLIDVNVIIVSLCIHQRFGWCLREWEDASPLIFFCYFRYRFELGEDKKKKLYTQISLLMVYL